MLAGSIAVVAAVAVVGGFVWSGIYNVGADDTHARPVHAMLQLVRDRSITARARRLHPPPNLDDTALIRQGAGNYDAMCTGCHLAPGMAATELSKGLYPPPPNLSQSDVIDPSRNFWVIKHGIKASGMPAWGKSMGDEYIWNMVAFLKVLPNLDARQYQAMVASSSGHAHGGGESQPHEFGETTPGDTGNASPPDESKPHDHATAPVVPPSRSGTVEHRHADGTVESHPAPADDDHEHNH
ncbi:MAG: cytochrome c [Pseudoxanthomonas sp.]